MKPNEISTALRISIIAALALGLACAAHAQGGPPPMGPGGFGGPMPGARGFGGPGMRPMAFGTVQSINADAHTIVFKNENGESRTIHVASDAKIIGQKTISVSDLGIGDRIQVRGHVSLLTADSIVAGGQGMGMPPMGPPPMGAMGGQGGFGPPPGAGGPAQDGPRFGPMGPGPMGGGNGVIVEVGTVTKLSPLTISFGGGRTLTVQVGSSTKVHKIGELKISEIKPGDRIMAMGRPMSDGSLSASRVAVNMPLGPGPGGRPGMGGFGPGGPGPGGPGFGPAAAFGPGGGPPDPSAQPDPGFDPQQGPPTDMPPPPDAGPGGPAPDGSAPDGSAPDGPPPADPQDSGPLGLN